MSTPSANELSFSQPETMNVDFGRWQELPQQMAFSSIKRQGAVRYPRAMSTLYGKPQTRPKGMLKPSSAGNSPRAINRRKTTASDTRKRQRLSQSSHFYPPESTQVRPTTWHLASQVPASYDPQTTVPLQYYSQQATPSLDPRLDPLNLYHHSSWQAPPTPSLYPNSEVMSPALPLSPSTAPYDLNEEDILPLSELDAAYSTGIYDSDLLFDAGVMPKFDPSQSFQPPMSANTGFMLPPQQHWTSLTPSQFLEPLTSPGFDDFLPLQYPEVPWNESTEHSSHVATESMERETGPIVKELVGMGLYENPDSSTADDGPLETYRRQLMTGLLGQALGGRESVGKGLKLEETWVPPEAKANDADAQSVSESEHEECSTETVQETASVPAPGQSFFLDDDSFMGEGQPSTSTVSMPVDPRDGTINDFAWI
ncbi:MAG: hypothetical protein M1833_007353 [Piccolia ochrophora]|nr:MAG: hypothetical protein M1833_007353 [Piccolia ochrophora]